MKGLEAWNLPTQSGTQNQSQSQFQTQNLPRDESMQVETAPTMMSPAQQRSQMSSGKSTYQHEDDH